MAKQRKGDGELGLQGISISPEAGNLIVSSIASALMRLTDTAMVATHDATSLPKRDHFGGADTAGEAERGRMGISVCLLGCLTGKSDAISGLSLYPQPSIPLGEGL